MTSAFPSSSASHYVTPQDVESLREELGHQIVHLHIQLASQKESLRGASRRLRTAERSLQTHRAVLCTLYALVLVLVVFCVAAVR